MNLRPWSQIRWPKESLDDTERHAGTTSQQEAFDVPFQGPYDAVLLTNFLHHFDVETCVALLKKVRNSLKPGGCVATLEFVPSDDRVSPPMPAAFSLTMLASTAAGDAYTFREPSEMHTQAGFSGVKAHPIPMSPHTVVMARA